MNRCAIYARCSTTHQDAEMQLAELREYAQRRGWEVAGEYVDRGVSGSKEKRPQLDRLKADAHKRLFDVVLVWKLDRFARSLRHLVSYLAELEATGIAFVSLHDQLDLSTPAGRLQFQIIGAMAEFEKSLIVQRVRSGIAQARRKGTKLGRPARKVNREQVTALRAAGASWREVSRETGIGLATLHRAARS